MADKQLREKVVELIENKQSGFLPWHKRIDAKTLAELEELRTAWRAGEIESPKRTLAKAISTVIRDVGIDVGPQGVIAWLDLDR